MLPAYGRYAIDRVHAGTLFLWVLTFLRRRDFVVDAGVDSGSAQRHCVLGGRAPAGAADDDGTVSGNVPARSTQNTPVPRTGRNFVICVLFLAVLVRKIAEE